MLSRLHALVIGCGLGKDATLLHAARYLCEDAAMQGASICFRIFNLKWMGCLRCFWKRSCRCDVSDSRPSGCFRCRWTGGGHPLATGHIRYVEGWDMEDRGAPTLFLEKDSGLEID